MVIARLCSSEEINGHYAVRRKGRVLISTETPVEVIASLDLTYHPSFSYPSVESVSPELHPRRDWMNPTESVG